MERSVERVRSRTVLVACAVLLAVIAGCGGGAGSGPASRTGSAPARADGGSGAASPSSPSSTPAADLRRFARLASPTGRLLVTTLDGPASGVRMKVWIWLPPQYDDPAYARTAFPALMLYPGGSGAGYNTWAGPLYGAQRLVSTGAAAGTVTPFVFVMPSMQLSEKLDTECADLPGQPKVGTFLAVDVRHLVESSFRVLPGRTAWGAAGASSGAYCATRLVFDHPDSYAAVVSIDGYFTIETTLPGAKDAAVAAQDPAAIAVSRPPAVQVLLWSGGRAGVDLKRAQAFQALVRPPTTARIEVLPGGRHLTSDFAKMMPGTFGFLTAALAGPATSSP